MEYFSFDRVFMYMGLILSAGAAWQAWRAKVAAKKAGEIVTLQKIGYDILEISLFCDLDQESLLSDIQLKYNGMASRLFYVTELLKDLIDQGILSAVENNLLIISNELSKPIIPEEKEIPNNIFNKYFSSFNQLKISLGKLKANIDKKLLVNNK